MDINAELEQDWPGLSQTSYRITSPHTGAYNCLAWAIAETDRWWSPLPDEDYGVAELRYEGQLLKLYSVLILAFQFELFIPQVSNAKTTIGRKEHLEQSL